MNTQSRRPAPFWLIALGGVGVAAIASGLAWALVIAAQNLARIGV